MHYLYTHTFSPIKTIDKLGQDQAASLLLSSSFARKEGQRVRTTAGMLWLSNIESFAQAALARTFKDNCRLLRLTAAFVVSVDLG